MSQVPELFTYSNNIYVVISLFATGLTLLIIFIAFIYKTDTIIKFFKLGDDMKAPNLMISNLTDLNIIKIAILIISLYFFVSHLPTFIHESVMFFSGTTQSTAGISGLLDQNSSSPFLFSSYLWINSVFNLSISYLLFSNYKSVSKFLVKKVVETSEELDEKL